jgi:hypothetical protein
MQILKSTENRLGKGGSKPDEIGVTIAKRNQSEPNFQRKNFPIKVFDK